MKATSKINVGTKVIVVRLSSMENNVGRFLKGSFCPYFRSNL